MPTTPTAEDLATGRWLFAQECVFTAGADNAAALPAYDLPEIAFAGRSNVGKSSLVNALTGRRTLARTSHTPGRTQQLNFFDLGRKLAIVDMPGYGYAKVGREKTEAWTALARDFLRGRPTLLRVFVLIDGRHGLKPVDGETLSAFDKSAISYAVVLTKSDEVKPADLARTVEDTAEALRSHPAAYPEVFVTSSAKGQGVAELRAHIVGLMRERGAPVQHPQ